MLQNIYCTTTIIIYLWNFCGNTMVFGYTVVKKRKKSGHTLTDEDREASLATRKAKAELKKIELDIAKTQLESKKMEARADLEALRDTLYPPTETTEESRWEQIIMGLLSGMNKSQPVAGSNTSTMQSEVIPPHSQEPATMSIDDEELRNILDTIPKKYIKMGKKMSDEQLTTYIKNHLPLADDDTVSRAIAIVRE